MPDLTINVPFTIRAQGAEQPEATAARAAEGLQAIAVHLARAGREWAAMVEGATDEERIAAAAKLPMEALTGIIAAELRGHVMALLSGEIAYRAQAAAQAEAAARQAQVEGLLG